MSYEFSDVEREIMGLTEHKPKKREYALEKLHELNHLIVMLRAEKLHKKQFLKI